ncbi:MAG: murein hydrolase activator EnvC family protein [Acutalibacteraceae bacterium]
MKHIGILGLAALITLTPFSTTDFRLGVSGEEALSGDTAPIEQPEDPGAQQPEEPADNGLTEEESASVYELQQQKLLLQQQAAQLQAARQYYSSSLDGLLAQKSNIEQQIELKQREINVNAQIKEQLTTQIETTGKQILDLEYAIIYKEQAINERYEGLRQKLRAMAKDGTGGLTTIQMLASSQSYADYLINSKMASRIAKIDQDVLAGLEEELAQIQNERALLQMQKQSLEEQRKPYEEAETALNANKNELTELRSQAELIAMQLNANITYYRQQYTLISEQQSRLQKQINEILKDTSLIGTVASGVMYWPAPGCSVITSSFKYRWGRQHNGVDIADWGESTGRPIVAAADGVVVYAGYDDGGYGNYLMVDHGYDMLGQRIITLYAHADMLYAQVGDMVYGGQSVIAAMGNTGNSTGAHLHFEVRVDGTAVDPVGSGYLSVEGISIEG